MSKLALGTAQFGSKYGIANQTGKMQSLEIKKILELAKEADLDLIDTAIAYGDGEKRMDDKEKYIRDFCYRYLFSASDIQEGEKFTDENLIILRSGKHSNGFHPREKELLVGMLAPRFIPEGTPINFQTLLKD